LVGVVGTGNWGRNHVRNFAELGALRAICDISETALARCREAYPEVRTYTDLGGVLGDPEITAIVLATPARHHYSGARTALQAGRHVLVEKPMTLSVEEADELTGLARQHGLVLMVGHILEYHPAFVKLKEWVADGRLGKLVYLYSHRLDLGRILQEENVLWSLAPHDLSMMLRLLGCAPDSVQATGSASITPGIEDSVTASLSFPNGVRAHVFVSWLHPFKEQRLVVIGTQGMAVFDDVVEEGKLKLYPGGVRWENDVPVPAAGEPEVVPYDSVEPLRAECQHFISCIRNGQRPLTDGLRGLEIARVLDACQHSLDADGAPA